MERGPTPRVPQRPCVAPFPHPPPARGCRAAPRHRAFPATESCSTGAFVPAVFGHYYVCGSVAVDFSSSWCICSGSRLCFAIAGHLGRAAVNRLACGPAGSRVGVHVQLPWILGAVTFKGSFGRSAALLL